MSAHIEEINDEDDANQQKDEAGDEDNHEMMAAAEPGSSSTTSKGKKNKKKKKPKASKADNIPQEVVDLVVNEVRHVLLLPVCFCQSSVTHYQDLHMQAEAWSLRGRES